MDVAGNRLYFADVSNRPVRAVDLSAGTIRYVAGTGTAGFSGDGGPATQAMLNFPYSIGLDEQQNLFIKDSNNCRIRRVDAASGTITTIAGNGDYGFCGDGGPALGASLATGR